MEPQVEKFKDQLRQLLHKARQPEFFNKDLGKHLRGHLDGHLWSITKVPNFITYACKEMVDRSNITKTPNPLERYKKIMHDTNDPHIKSKMPTLKTVCLAVLRGTLQHYSRK